MTRSTTPPQDRLAAIQAHLHAGGTVMTVTEREAFLYTQEHVGMFSATKKGLFVQSNIRTQCLNFTAIQFI
jgi:hypothetical protein